MNNINVCIIGAGGQLGSKLVENFSKNKLFKIYALDKFFQNKLSYDGVNYISLDLNESFEEKFKQVPNSNTIFINCVGVQHVLFSRKIIDLNFKLNKKLFDYINSNYFNYRFIHMSSLSVDNAKTKEIIPGVGNPINLYGKSKLLFEKYLYENSNNNITIIRPAAFYDSKISNNLLNFFDLLVNKIFFLPSQNIYRSFLSLEYFSKFLEEYILSEDKLEIFEIGDVSPIEFNSLLKFIKKSNIQINSKIFYLPKVLFKTVGHIGYVLEKLGLHISFLTIIGEFAYDFVATKEPDSYGLVKQNTYENFRDIIKGIN